MLTRFAIIFIVSLFVFSTTVIAGPNDKTKKKSQPAVQTTSIKSPRDVASGQKTSRQGQLIDTSTGEIVWADEVRSGKTRKYAPKARGGYATDEELGALVAW